MTVTIPLRVVSELNARSHWAAKAKRTKQARVTVGLVVRGARPPKLPVVVTLIRIAPSSGLDDDNLAGALKAARDGVADALGVDDRDARVEWQYCQYRGKEWGVEIRIEPR